MKTGFHKTCVTPPVGMAMEGLGQAEGCKSIHDDLFVRALHLSHGEAEALIVVPDLLFFERPVVDRFKAALGHRLGLRPSQIFLNNTHTHAGPRVTHWAYSDGPDPLYLDRVEAAMIEAATRAKASAREVTVWAGTARTTLPVSRRKPKADGKVEWKPYRKGVICDALPFCLFKDAGGAVVSMLFSVSCHPSMIYEYVISAEWPGAAMRYLNAHYQTEGAMFLQGAAGDTKPRHVADGEERWRHGTWDEMESAGREVADAVIAQAAKNLTQIEPDLRTSLNYLRWPLTPGPSRAELEAVRKNPDERVARHRWAEDMIGRLDRNGRLPQAVPVALHALQIGKGLRLFGVEGEIVGELGNLILSEYDRGVTFPLGYSNGCQIYLTTTRMLPELGYEVFSYWEYHWPSALAPNGEKVLLDGLRELRESGRFPNE